MRNSPLLLSLALLFAACTAESDPVTPRWEAGPQGRWYHGDFHVHTSVGSNDTRTDGVAESWPTLIKQTAIERGMNFVVITDHSNSAGSVTTTTREDGRTWNQGPEFPVWDTAATLSGPTFLMIDGSEISPVSTLQPNECDHCSSTGSGNLTPVGHVGCFPADLATFDTKGIFTDRPPGAVLGKRAIDDCHAMGGLTVVNHPFPTLTPWIEFDWTSFDYDAIEVWNGSLGWDLYDAAAYDAYLCDRLEGRKVVAVGGSDNHRTPLVYGSGPVNIDPPLGLPMTSLLAPALDWEALVDAFSHGRIVVHDRETFVEFRVFGDDGYLGGVGDEIAGSKAGDSVTVWLRGTSKRPGSLRLWRVAPNACTEERVAGSDRAPTVEKTVMYETKVVLAFEHKTRLQLAHGLYFATVGAYQGDAKLNVRDVAITNVFTVRP